MVSRFVFNDCIWSSPITNAFVEKTIQGDNHYVEWIEEDGQGSILYYQEVIAKSIYEKVVKFLAYREKRVRELSLEFEIKFEAKRQKELEILRNS